MVGPENTEGLFGGGAKGRLRRLEIIVAGGGLFAGGVLERLRRLEAIWLVKKGNKMRDRQLSKTPQP